MIAMTARFSHRCFDAANLAAAARSFQSQSELKKFPARIGIVTASARRFRHGES